MGRGFEPRWAHHNVVAQTGLNTSLKPRLSGPPLAAGRFVYAARPKDKSNYS